MNLLDDSLVDVVLDAAAGGWNTVEREGVSVFHPAKFLLIGSGNPEEVRGWIPLKNEYSFAHTPSKKGRARRGNEGNIKISSARRFADPAFIYD